MSLLSYVDIYCERTDIGILGEPLNALSNMAFFVAAAYLYLLYEDRHHRDRQSFYLIACIAVVGFGSSLFHIFSNVLTMHIDVAMISVFVLYYLWVSLRRFLHWGNGITLLSLLGFSLMTYVMQIIPSPFNLNGSTGYLPCLAAIIYLGMRMKELRHESAETFFIAATWFAVSLFFRVVDIALCDLVSIGTHFLWHFCNSVVLALLVKQVIEHPPLTLRNN